LGGGKECACRACKSPSLDTEVVCGKVGVERVRELVEQAKKRPYVSKRQVFVFDSCEFSFAASSALLKILEEALDHSVFILVVQPGQYVSQTVYSRAQVLRFNLLTPEQVRGIAGNVGEELLQYMVSVGSVPLKETKTVTDLLGSAAFFVGSVKSMSVLEVSEFVAEVVLKAGDTRESAGVFVNFVEYVLSTVVKSRFYGVKDITEEAPTPWTTPESLAAVKAVSRARAALATPTQVETALFGLAMQLKLGAREV